MSGTNDTETINMENNIELIQISDITDDLKSDQLNDLETNFKISLVNAPLSDDLQSLELTDCKIELMDQFKLTDHIDLCSNDIHLNERDIFCDEIICDINETSRDDTLMASIINNIEPMICVAEEVQSTLPADNVKYVSPSISIESDGKMTERLTQHHKVRDNKRKSDYRVDEHEDDDDDDDSSKAENTKLEFMSWLNSVIERINLTMDYNDRGDQNQLILDVYHVNFAYILIKFSF